MKKQYSSPITDQLRVQNIPVEMGADINASSANLLGGMSVDPSKGFPMN